MSRAPRLGYGRACVNVREKAGFRSKRLQRAARLISPLSGLRLTVLTTKPGLQVYDGHLIRLSVPGLRGQIYGARAGLCLETQFFPDSPNQPGFPPARLAAGDIYDHVTDYVFDRPAAAKSGP